MHPSIYHRLAAATLALAMVLATAAPSAARGLLEVVAAEGDRTRSVAIEEAEFEALPQTTVVTETPWTDPGTRFTGVLLRDLLSHLELPIGDVSARALNDYEAVIPAADIENFEVLIARQMNGAPMPVREKGPLWIIYPLTDRPELANPDTEAKMVWQLHRLTLQ